jgi:DMSO/TMAO reductase YedYZ molybdopterin-dependent catalytic subunit
MMVTASVLFFIVSDAAATNLCRYDPPLTEGGYSPSFILGGEVLNPKTFDETTLRQYESTKVEVVYGAGSGIESGSFVGVLLWDLINEAGVIVDPTRKNDQLRKYVVITGSDGYQVILALGEIIPDFGAQQVVVAYERDGQTLGADQGVARLVVPGDKRGGRHLNRITHIAVCDSPPDRKNR